MSRLRTIIRTSATRIGSASRSRLHIGASTPVLALTLTGVLPTRGGFVLVGSLLIAGLGHLGVELRARVTRRQEADRLLVAIDTERVPERLRWRAAELTRPRERRALARALRSLVRSLDLPPRFLPAPVNRSALRRNRRAVESLAACLTAVDRTVSPRGILLVRELLQGSTPSPLYDIESGGDLHMVLARVRSEIEPR